MRVPDRLHTHRRDDRLFRYAPYRRRSRAGAVSLEQGSVRALGTFEERGVMFINPGEAVYGGMIGEHSRATPTSTRSSPAADQSRAAANKDDAVQLTPPRPRPRGGVAYIVMDGAGRGHAARPPANAISTPTARRRLGNAHRLHSALPGSASSTCCGRRGHLILSLRLIAPAARMIERMRPSGRTRKPWPRGQARSSTGARWRESRP